MKSKIIICFFVISYSVSVHSRENNVLDSLKVPDVIDSLFIDRNVNNWSIRIFANYKDNRFILKNSENKINYVTSNPYGIGVGFATRKLILDFAFNIKGNSLDVTNRFDIQASLILKKHLINFHLQKYQGFNVEDELGIYKIFRDDISTLSGEISYMYLFNADRYSMNESTPGLISLKKTTISFGLGGFLVLKNQSADSSIIPEIFQPQFNDEAQITRFSGAGAGIQGGVNVIFPLPSNFFTSLSVNPGIGLVFKNIETESINFKPGNPLLYKIDLAAALGYIRERIYVTLRMGLNISGTDLDYGNRILFNTSNAKLALGYKLWKKK